MFKNAITLAGFAIFCALIITTTFLLTDDKIADNIEQAKRQSLQEILSANQYDNDVLQDTRIIAPDKLLNTKIPTTVHLAKKNHQPVAAIFTVIAPDGYSGEIQLLIAVYWNGDIAGVSTIAHRETPGLGDKIETRKSPWLKQFIGKSLRTPEESGWQVIKDQGEFDALTGATITSRAVVNAVKNALIYFEQHKHKLIPLPINGEG